MVNNPKIIRIVVVSFFICTIIVFVVMMFIRMFIFSDG